MALILRIDVDRPYGKQGIIRHVASRLRSDYYFPVIQRLRYLDELKIILTLLNARRLAAFVFFRKCTLPSAEVKDLMSAGGHIYGLHLENSRTIDTFRNEHLYLQNCLHSPIETFSKHGSGKHRYGRNHYAPYEPQKYVDWGRELGLKLFFGNWEDPSIEPVKEVSFTYFPSAYWLEPHWRSGEQYNIRWLMSESIRRDIVLMLHPDNVTSSKQIMDEFITVLDHLEFRAPSDIHSVS